MSMKIAEGNVFSSTSKITPEYKELFNVPNTKKENERDYNLNYMKWYNAEKIVCQDCQKSVVRGSIRRHERSAFHLKNSKSEIETPKSV